MLVLSGVKILYVPAEQIRVLWILGCILNKPYTKIISSEDKGLKFKNSAADFVTKIIGKLT